ncbi:nucleoside triphosphate pyrophosphohydrolase family protein [Mesoterricola silvestris]|uniref:Uncharacterized protein n=1 Tax=Mesoterricola silvestris TaxID=2927979 RepID=A0AA48K915_9BACT|nr:hypothetical protein [Mesoterricola silvestris]BDU72936.1 hypothetical protein METEAL_21100 [Mesoterricola silvestris]
MTTFHPFQKPKTRLGEILPPDKLAQAIAQGERLIREHKAVRPSNLDIPAITAWAQHKAILDASLSALRHQAAATPRDVPFPAGPLPRAAPQAQEPRSIPPPTKPASSAQPQKEPMVRPTLNPEKRLRERIDKILALTSEAKAATTSEEFVKVRQRIHCVRYEVPGICRENGIPIPELPPIPENPFPKAAPGVKPKAPGPTSREAPIWVAQVLAELARARTKFPGADHSTLALAEEAGEVVKAVLDIRNGKPGATKDALHMEIIQTMAMCVRLMEEGDPTVLGQVVANG